MSTNSEASVERGAARKHDELTVTHEKNRSTPHRYFNDDGNKVTDVSFVGGSAPDTDPAPDSELEPTES